MGEEIDDFCELLLEESKRFLEKANETSDKDGKIAFLHSSLVLGYASLEAYFNAISTDFEQTGGLSILDRSIMFEKKYELKNGSFELTNILKIYSVEDRFLFLYSRFKGKKFNKTVSWWSDFKDGITYRNQITHPKKYISISSKRVERYLISIINAIDVLYQAIYKRKFPVKNRGLESRKGF